MILIKKRTLVLGASSNPDRYSFKAMKSLQKLNIPFVGIGRKETETDELRIFTGQPRNIRSNSYSDPVSEC